MAVGLESSGDHNMAHRRRQSITKLSRREGYALHPKAHKALVNRPNKPGRPKGGREPKTSQYSTQLREKQKVKRIYGVLEKQFRRYVKEASRRGGVAGENLLVDLEKRLDNVVYRAGFASSRQAARQLVTHGHFMLNGTRVDIPSIQTKAGDVIEVRKKSQTNEYFKHLEDLVDTKAVTVSWLVADHKKLNIKINGLPTREEVDPGISEQLIIEFYSR